jgi:hypothetical protein
VDAVFSFFVFQKKSVFVPLRYVYPECSLLLQETKMPDVFPLSCLQQDCDVNQNCAETLALRVNYWFTHVVPDAEMIFAYFKYPDRPKSVRVGVFDRNMGSPKVIVANKSAFTKFKDDAEVFQWVPPSEYLFLTSSSSQTIVPVNDLVKLL